MIHDAWIIITNGMKWYYSKTCLQETPQYPRESVPTSCTWHVSLCHRFFYNMGKIGDSSEKVSPDHRVSPGHSVPWRQVLLYEDFLWPTNCYIKLWWLENTWSYIHYHCEALFGGGGGGVKNQVWVTTASLKPDHIYITGCILWLLVYRCHSWVMLMSAPEIDGGGGGGVFFLFKAKIQQHY